MESELTNLLPVLSLKTLNSLAQDLVLFQENRFNQTENFIETNLQNSYTPRIANETTNCTSTVEARKKQRKERQKGTHLFGSPLPFGGSSCRATCPPMKMKVFLTHDKEVATINLRRKEVRSIPVTPFLSTILWKIGGGFHLSKRSKVGAFRIVISLPQQSDTKN